MSLIPPHYDLHWLSNDLPQKDIPTLNVGSHFFDSGSFTMRKKAIEFAKEHGKSMAEYYDTPEFYDYMDRYAVFVKKYSYAIDLYANMDAIQLPKVTWRNQVYLEEKHELSPVPVVHFRSSLKWLAHYIERGHDIIALGGLAGQTMQTSCRKWIDAAFDIVCDTPDRLPVCKIHGFGISSCAIIRRYPWHSVDSSSHSQSASYGGLLIPRKRNGKFDFNLNPFTIAMSIESPDRKNKGRHYFNLTPKEKRHVEEWVEMTGLPMGSIDKNGEIVTPGLTNRVTDRRVANILYFEEFLKTLPEWPWPWKSRRRKGLNLL